MPRSQKNDNFIDKTTHNLNHFNRLHTGEVKTSR